MQYRVGTAWRAAIVTSILMVSIVIASACARREPQGTEHVSFNTPEEAVAALVDSLEKSNLLELRRLLGPDSEALLSSGDAVADGNERESFLRRYGVQHTLVAGGPDELVLEAGSDNWPLPIPLVRDGGRWHFDGAAGSEELVLRRIGANELRTIDVMRGFVAAQRDYAAMPHDGIAAGTYAQKLRSDPGTQDGLYWEVKAGEPQSPAGPLLAAADAEGYSEQHKGMPYHGYVYRMLFAQGPAADGGSRHYIVDGRLKSGFGLIARPAVYGVSGVMTFMVNQDGVIWQRDLGEDTARLAGAIREVNPDDRWTPIPPES